MDHAGRSFTRRSLLATRIFFMQGEATLPKGGRAHRVGLPGSKKPPGAGGASGAPVRSMVARGAWVPGVPGAFLGFGVPLVCFCAAQVTSTLTLVPGCSLRACLGLQRVPHSATDHTGWSFMRSPTPCHSLPGHAFSPLCPFQHDIQHSPTAHTHPSPPPSPPPRPHTRLHLLL